MPVTPTAKRALRHSRLRAVVNIRRKKAVKKAVDGYKSNPKSQGLSLAVSQIDRALKHHLIPKNKAARMKSQLSGLLAVAPKPSSPHKTAVK